MGIVDAKLQAVPVGGFLQLLDDVALERRVVDDVVGGDCGIIQREAVVMLRGDDDISGAAILEGPCPLVGVELGRIKVAAIP